MTLLKCQKNKTNILQISDGKMDNLTKSLIENLYGI